MAYTAPFIDDAGLHVPSYIDIRDDLIEQFKQIYGQDIYLENDSQRLSNDNQRLLLKLTIRCKCYK